MDSDDDSIDPQDESLRRQGRLDPFHVLQEQMRLPGGPRRANREWDEFLFICYDFQLTLLAPFDSEGPEISHERTRAARRAAAAAVKLVASASALASLERVDLKGLKGDERSKSYSS
jgi:hypothetical protein